MADYTTYTTLLKEVDTSRITVDLHDCNFGTHSDGFSVVIYRETDDNFESLLNILGLEKDNLPVIESTYITAEQWREHGCAAYEGEEDFPISDLHCLNNVVLEWKGTDEEYNAYKQDKKNNPDLHKWVAYGSLEYEYPELAKLAYNKALRCIVFRKHYWGNWLGDGAMHGDFNWVIFAKDAAKHMRNDMFLNEFERAEHFVENAEAFAKEHGDEIAVIFGFG